MTSRCLRWALAALIVSSSAACTRSDSVGKDSANTLVAPVASSAPVPPGSPLSRLVPPPHPGPRTACPLRIEPGVGFGPVLLGETVADLEHAGLTVKKVSDTHAEVSLPGSGETLKVTLCEGKIIDIWIDDLRKTACVEFAGTAIAMATPREDLEKALGGCTDTGPRIGGAFERCQDGGVYVGHGMGTFLQIRVRPKGWPFDDACAIASDDGSPIPLAASERESMLRQTLNLPALGDHWHVNEPGRDPLRIVKSALVPEFALTMFGSNVVWIDEADAKKGGAFLRITAVSATKTKASLSFEYPIEGVVGTATFSRPAGSAWKLEHGELHER